MPCVLHEGMYNPQTGSLESDVQTAKKTGRKTHGQEVVYKLLNAI
jgi:hypothetical protein